MDITNITNFKPDTELHNDNPFQRTEMERAKRRHGDVDGPDQKRSKTVMPAYLEKVAEDGVRLDEEELEERRQELLAKAEIQAGDAEELDEANARKILALFEKRRSKNQELRIKHAKKAEKFMKSEIELHDMIQDMRQFATNIALYPLLWLDEISSGLSLSNLVTLCSHENNDIAAAVIQTLYELVDQEEAESEEMVATLLVKYIEYDVIGVAVGSMKRFDENILEEQDALYTCFQVVESIMEGSDDPEIATKIGASGSFLIYLLKRLRGRTINSIKIYAGEMLAVLLQNSDANREKVGAAEGVDILLKQLANFKKKDPKDAEEIELMENLFNCLCSILQFTPNRKKFLDGEGLHLMNLMLKERKMSRNSALKVIDHALSGKEGIENCEKFVEILGLRTLFPLFMKTPKRNKKSGHTENDHEEHIISIIGSLLRNLKDNKPRDRLVAKFVELDHAKTDRLLELHFKYMDKVDEGEKDIIKRANMLANEGQDMDGDMIYIQKMELGLFTLQQVDYIIVELFGANIESLNERILTHLQLRKSSLRKIREVIREYADNLGDGENPEAEEAERQRLMGLAMSL